MYSLLGAWHIIEESGKLLFMLLTFSAYVSCVNNIIQCIFFYSCSSEGISVTGYDTLLTKDDLKNALTNHFSTCGEITDVFVLNRLEVGTVL